MPCSINSSLNSLTRKFMRRATWGCDSFEADTLAALGAVYVCALRGGKCCRSGEKLACRVLQRQRALNLHSAASPGNCFLHTNEAEEQVWCCYSWHRCPSQAGIPPPLSSPVQIINKGKYIIPFFSPRAKSRSAKVNTKQS